MKYLKSIDLIMRGAAKHVKNGKLRLIIVITLLLSSIALAQTNEFTFQGKLSETGTPSPTYDFEFRLCDVAKACKIPLDTLQRLDVPVSNGSFTVKLDFSAALFDGTDRWLEVAVKRSKQPDFTTLAPLQKITSTPYAIRSQSADTATTAENAAQLGGLGISSFVKFDENGDVRIGDTGKRRVAGPASKLTVAGVIESTSGGFKFPDATTQMTAGLTTVTTDASMTGNGTKGAPLGVVSPQESSALQAVQVSGTTFNGVAPILTVPDGKRLVIEFISGSLSTLNGQRFQAVYLRATIDANGTLRNHYFVPVFIGTQTGGVDFFQMSQQVRIYANPGTTVYLGLNTTSGSGTFNGTISGYYVDMP